LTTGEICAHFAQIYGASASKEALRPRHQVAALLHLWNRIPRTPFLLYLRHRQHALRQTANATHRDR